MGRLLPGNREKAATRRAALSRRQERLNDQLAEVRALYRQRVRKVASRGYLSVDGGR